MKTFKTFIAFLKKPITKTSIKFYSKTDEVWIERLEFRLYGRLFLVENNPFEVHP